MDNNSGVLVNILRDNPSRLSDHDLLFLDYMIHNAWKNKRDGGVVRFPPFSFEFLAELHLLIKREMYRRCFRHLITDELDAHSSFLDQQRRTVAVGFAGRIEGIPRD
jgi:hypothetical protein